MKSANSAIHIKDYPTALKRYDELDKQVTKIGLQAAEISVYKGIFQYARAFIAKKKGEDPLPYLQAMMRHFKKAFPNLAPSTLEWKQAYKSTHLASMAHALTNGIRLLDAGNPQHLLRMYRMMDLTFSVDEKLHLIDADPDPKIINAPYAFENRIEEADREKELGYREMEATYLLQAYQEFLPKPTTVNEFLEKDDFTARRGIGEMPFLQVGIVAYRLAGLADERKGIGPEQIGHKEAWAKRMLKAFEMGSRHTSGFSREGEIIPTTMRCLQNVWKLKHMQPLVEDFAVIQQAIHQGLQVKRDDFPSLPFPPISYD